MQTNEQFASRHGARLFCISDFKHKRGNFARSYGRASEQRRESNIVREESLPFQQYIDSSQLDEDIFGSSEALLPALVHVPNLAATDCTVLISGEAGTGSELVARAIHRLSYRSPQAFVRVNCAATPLQLIACEQVGRQKGSWSQATQPRPDSFQLAFQLAKGGTIFLEDVGDLSAEAQLTVLRVLQEIESQPTHCNDSIPSDVRLIATTNRDLRAAAADGTFRSDLFDRLDGFPIKVPSLRERKGDIPILARYFLNRYARRADKAVPNLTRPAMDLLQSYPWPGNMRELQRVMERLVSLCEVEGFLGGCEGHSPRIHFGPHLIPIGIRRAGSDQKEFFEDALTEMLAELLGWEPGVSWDQGSIGIGRDSMKWEVCIGN